MTTARIDRDVLESYLRCKYKGRLKLAGQQGTKGEYEVLLTEFAGDVQLQAIDKILSGHEGEEVPRNVPLTVSALKQGAAFLLDAILDDDAMSLVFDGLKRVTGPSNLGDFHYVPLLFSDEKRIRPEHRVLLEVYGVLLTHIQGRTPRHGILWHEKECVPTRIKLSAGLRKGEQVLRELNEMMRSSASPPRLLLNDHCPKCEFRQGCLARAEEVDSLTLLDRMTPKLIKRYEKKGIFTVTQLSYLFRPRRRKAKRKGGKGFKVELQAFALRTGTTFLQAAPRLTRNYQELFLDVESNPDDGFVYLVGLLICDGEAIAYCSFWADRLQDEKNVWVEALAKIWEYPGAPVYHYGSYDRKVMEKAAKKYQMPCEDVLGRMANVASHIYGQVYFPVRSNGLKDVGKFVGASWTSPNASGLQCLYWRHRWEQTPVPELKEQIVKYNEEDCIALRLVTERLAKLGKAASTLDNPGVEFADRLTRQATPAGHDLHEQFEEIIEFAHFSYQKKRILLRPPQAEEAAETSLTPEKKERRLVFRRVPPTRATRSVTVRRRMTCPRCRVRLVKSDMMAETIITDLLFTKNGCRKTFVKYVGAKGYCETCGCHSLPPTISKKSPIGYGFQAWVTYQRVALRQPYEAITVMMEDMFEERITTSTAVSFVRNLANRYTRAEATLLRRLLTSPFIHVDDTKVNIQGEAQYVWVFTDGVHVVFRMTPTREADIVHELLAGYEGVMVSDFYPGFDSVKCRQQRCIIHLVRDINDELWDNPFDTQLETFAAAVKDLFVPILQDVQRYGLKRRHLHKHRTSVDRFYRDIIGGAQFTSDVSARFHARFQRYKESLFLFLEEDTIPWNNNTGERALRHMAVQRKISGTFFKSFASSYLVLLAVAQTCRFQGKSFLKFLLSGEMDVDLFRPHQRRRRTKPIGEVRDAGEDTADSLSNDL